MNVGIILRTFSELRENTSLITMSTSTITVPFVDSCPPTWASGYGQDKYGYFSEFSVSTGSQYWDVVKQRMRWIPPGVFLMGSPPGEVGRDEMETRHEVSLSRGYWLADTVCTQEMWSAITEEFPSNSTGPDRPVECVSHEDIMRFLSELGGRVWSLNPLLPTEAQWEYGCRAGTLGPFCFGESIGMDQANFDGDHPYENSVRGNVREETVAVKDLLPNSWGLYQMHGNVWEWCSDWYGEYCLSATTDPLGPTSGSDKVVRGGGWRYYARGLRSACRYRRNPTAAFNDLGFRLLSPAN